MSKPHYGIDAPGVIRNFILIGLGMIAVSLVWTCIPALPLRSAVLSMTLCIGAYCFLAAGWMIWTSLCGKRVAARRMIDQTRLRGDEVVLDIGCGRGLLVIEAASRLTSGRAFGLDIWNAEDLSGNGSAALQANLVASGMTPKVSILDADMRTIPLPDASVDCIVSSLAIHNLYDAQQREAALLDMMRVLKPGGQMLIQDFRHTRDYAEILRRSGASQVTRTLVGPHLMFPPTWRVHAIKA